MAGRKAKETVILKSIPKLPEDMEEIQVSATLPTGKTVKDDSGKDVAETSDKVVTIRVPKINNAGVIAYQKYREANGAKDDNFVAHSVRTAAVKGTLAYLAKNPGANSLSILPNASQVRVTDETEANAKIIAEKLSALKASGKKPSAKDLEAILAEMMA